jgi:hypothetical protein
MPYATNRDRVPGALEITKSPWPLSPLNLTLRSGFRPGVFELTWDDPTGISVNRDFNLVGVNIYRSFDSEFGPFERITDVPVGSTFWRDVTNNVLVEEDVSDRFSVFGATAAGMDQQRFVFKTMNAPIVKEASQQIPANSPYDVQVYVDGVLARVRSVTGLSGEVELDVRDIPEVGTQTYTKAVIPTADSKVTCVYRYTKSLLKTTLMQRVFYRVTAVGIHVDADLGTVQSQALAETPLADAVSTSSYEVEKLDFMWKEAVRRNRWILEQGGERVRLFLRKHVGPLCPCTPDHFHKQAINDCLTCYGTGIVGGYEGPYDTIVAPDDGERRIAQKEHGLSVEHTYEVWTGPMPILTQRDFLVKLNGERYSVGPVRFPSNRGMILQQHFSIAHISESDIRRHVPLDAPVKYASGFAPSGPENGGSSDTTDKPEIPEDRQLRGRTRAWENTEF